MKCRQGFTLIEVMAAVVILSIALLSLLRANNQTLLLKAHAQDITTATLLAQERLAELRIEPESLDEESDGDFGDRYPNWRWSLSKEETELPFDFAGLEPIKTVSGEESPEKESAQSKTFGATEDEPSMLYKLTLTVFWPEGVDEGELTLVEYLAQVDESAQAEPMGTLQLPEGAFQPPGAGGGQ